MAQPSTSYGSGKPSTLGTARPKPGATKVRALRTNNSFPGTPLHDLAGQSLRNMTVKKTEQTVQVDDGSFVGLQG
jgi:hypothetical protein